MKNRSQNASGDEVTGNDVTGNEVAGDEKYGRDEGETGITVLDVTGLQCPLPVLKTQKALRAVEIGQILQVISTDPMATIDIPHFCSQHGHKMLRQEPKGDATVYVLQKGRGSASRKD